MISDDEMKLSTDFYNLFSAFETAGKGGPQEIIACAARALAPLFAAVEGAARERLNTEFIKFLNSNADAYRAARVDAGETP